MIALALYFVGLATGLALAYAADRPRRRPEGRPPLRLV